MFMMRTMVQDTVYMRWHEEAIKSGIRSSVKKISARLRQVNNSGVKAFLLKDINAALYNGFWGKSGGMVQVGHPYGIQ